MYAARRAEVEEMRRRTFLPYQQGLLFGCLGLTSRLSSAAAAAAGKSRVFTPSTPRALSGEGCLYLYLGLDCCKACVVRSSAALGASHCKNKLFGVMFQQKTGGELEHFLSASPECQAVISMPNGQPNDDRCRLLTGQRGMLGIMTASSFSGSNLKMPKLLIRYSLLFSLVF
uniref:Uncharacterized protein n=1 Tax=Oryza glumipatula TaxID=40148 RepID=A0A0E0BTZ9_9ORYZ